jgi:hypothetical protein
MQPPDAHVLVVLLLLLPLLEQGRGVGGHLVCHE